MKRLSRRQFVKLACATATATFFAPGCTPGAAGPAPTRTQVPAPGGEEVPSLAPTRTRSLAPTAGVAPPSTPTAGSAASSAPTVEPAAPSAPAAGHAYLAVARGSDPARLTQAALAALGGIERFVKSGDDVIVKPNICVAYHTPEYAATTNPAVVASLVTLCLGAGARRVRVMDMPFGGTPEAAYAISGIEEAVKAAGGEMEIMSPIKFAKTAIPEGKDITSWEIYQDVLNADVVINVPIAKHHSSARLSLGIKNLLGVITRPNLMHRDLGQRPADLASRVRPSLTVVDAVRILVAHGPSGGSLNDVRQMDTVIASHDFVAADAYAATLFGMSGADIPYIQAAARMDLGTLELDRVKLEEINV
ncbi:MAG: DUF362 domain-containing protein [Thermoflexales bacterium]|nr:DUF362 domain-containing protein [Thermoflexales bacterium]